MFVTASSPRFSTLALLSASILLASGAQLLMRLGMHDLAALDPVADWELWLHFEWVLYRPLLWVLCGLACYALSMLTWLGVLGRLPLSVAYPLLSLSYALVYLAAVAWLGESLTLWKSLGIALIIFGVGLISRPAKKTS